MTGKGGKGARARVLARDAVLKTAIPSRMPWGFLVRLGPRCTFKMRAKPVPEALLDRCNYRTSAVSAPGPVLIRSYRSSLV